MATTRRFIVRTTRRDFITMFSVFFLAGCGGDEAPKKVDTTPTPPPEQFKGMLDDQRKNAKIKEKPSATPAN
jgi:hypothetical protein